MNSNKWAKNIFLLVFSFFVSCSSLFSQDNNSQEDVIPLIGGRLENAVTLDGMITSSDEWSDTEVFNMKWGLGIPPKSPFINARVWVKNDDAWLFLLFRVEWPTEKVDQFDAGQITSFWGKYRPPWDYSDHGSIDLGGWGGTGWDAYGWDDSKWYADIESGGRNNVEGAATHDGSYYWFEFRKGLYSEDGHDWSLEPGDIRRALIGLWNNSIHREYHHDVLIWIY